MAQGARQSTAGSTTRPLAAGPVSLWRNRDFMVLWSSQVVSTVGTRATSIAFPLLVRRRGAEEAAAAGDLDHLAAQGRRPAWAAATPDRQARPAPGQGRPAALPGHACRHDNVHEGRGYPLQQDRRHLHRHPHLPVALGLRHPASDRRADPRQVSGRLRPGPGHHRYRRARCPSDRALRGQVEHRGRYRRRPRSSAPGRPATAPPARSSGPSPSSSPARRLPPAGTPPPATTPPTWPITGPAPPGTPARPSPPPPTWPPSSAASSSPPDLRHLALTSRHPKKSASSAWHGKTSSHNRESRAKGELACAASYRPTLRDVSRILLSTGKPELAEGGASWAGGPV